MEELTKEYTDKVRKYAIEPKRVLIYSEHLMNMLSVAYKIEPADVFRKTIDVYESLIGVYRESDQLNEAINEYYSNTSTQYVSVKDITSWFHEFNRVGEIR